MQKDKMAEIEEVQLSEWERGMLLMEVLAEEGAKKEQYFDFLNSRKVEVIRANVFNQFNLKAFLNNLKEIKLLASDKYYWVKQAKGDDWETAWYTGSFFCLTGEEGDFDAEDFWTIHTTPIDTPEEGTIE